MIRLEHYVQELIEELNNDPSILIHKKIDQFYYMQKVEELKLLRIQLEEAKIKLEDIHYRAIKNYQEVYNRWRSDVRWIKDFKIQSGALKSQK